MKTGHTRVKRPIMAVTLGILVAMAVVAAVAMVAGHKYQIAQLRSKFTAVVKATDDFKTAIELCAKFGPCTKSGILSGLEDGTMGIPHSRSSTYLASVRVASNGTITATATQVEGLAGETYVLTPSYVKGSPMTWVAGGTCKTRAGGAIC